MKRIDIEAKSTGQARFGIDLDFPNMLYAAVKLNPHKDAKLLEYDSSEAEKMRGIKKVVPVDSGVAVIGDNSWRCFKAADAISCKWAKADYPDEMEDHWKILSESFIEDRRDGQFLNEGKVDEIVGESGAVQAEYKAPMLAHQPLEPLNAVVKAQDDKIEIWTCTQTPDFVQDLVSKATGVSADRVLVYNQIGGGSFGHRLENSHIKQAAQAAMAVKGQAIKLTYTRETDFCSGLSETDCNESGSRGCI